MKGSFFSPAIDASLLVWMVGIANVPCDFPSLFPSGSRKKSCIPLPSHIACLHFFFSFSRFIRGSGSSPFFPLKAFSSLPPSQNLDMLVFFFFCFWVSPFLVSFPPPCFHCGSGVTRFFSLLYFFFFCFGLVGEDDTSPPFLFP